MDQSSEELISEYEIAARTARAQHSAATVSLLQSLKSMEHSMKVFTGNAFVIKLDKGGCKLITCYHLIQKNLEDSDYHIWARFFGASEDAEVTIQYFSVEKDIAILDVAQLPNKVSPTVLQFSKRTKVGTTVTLLGYFSPGNMNKMLGINNLISKEPKAVPGTIVGPVVLDSKFPKENWLLSHDCYGIYGSCGSPIIYHKSGKVLAMFKQSISQIHFGIATKTIEVQLRHWLGASEEDNMEQLIAKL